jgi:hypothetical protein
VPSRDRSRTAAVAAAIAMLWSAAHGAQAVKQSAAAAVAPTSAAAMTAVPAPVAADHNFTPPEVGAAVEKLRADPNLQFTRSVRTLRWAGKQQQVSNPPSWLEWVLNLFRWIAETGRIFVWVALAISVAVIVIFVVRIIRAADLRGSGSFDEPPTHVRDLDIRPQSLPDDIGAAAKDLWNRGEHRQALALLYRGALSRLVHEHRVPIKHSTTEGECVSLAALHLGADSLGYLSGLVRVWQRAVYGGTDPQTDIVISLCDGFSAALDPPPPAAEASAAA